MIFVTFAGRLKLSVHNAFQGAAWPSRQRVGLEIPAFPGSTPSLIINLDLILGSPAFNSSAIPL